MTTKELENYTPKGDLTGFPKEIIARMLECQEEQGNPRDISVFEKDRRTAGGKCKGFYWNETKEGVVFWYKVIDKKDFDLFFEKYPQKDNQDNSQDFKLGENKIMKIEEQVLSIEQVQELQELGFDVLKHSSTYYLPNWEIKWGEYEIQNYHLTIGALREEDTDCIPTLTIGDIIEMLPTEIDEYVLNMNRRYVSYDSRVDGLFYAYRTKFIDSLFDCLVWCIKQKHIAL